MLNIGMFIFPIMIGSIKDMTIDVEFGYFYVSVFFIMISAFAFAASFLLLIYDYRYQDSLLQARDPYKIILQRKFAAQRLQNSK